MATAAGVVSLALQQPILDAQAGVSSTILNTASLLEIIMAAAIMAIAVAIHPILKVFSERLALGYLTARTLEAVAVAIDAGLLLTLTTLHGDSAAQFRELLSGQRDGTGVVVTMAFTISALILNFMLYRARLVPRWLSGWGLVGSLLYLVGGTTTLYSLDVYSTTAVVLAVPLAIQEMTLAIWLIFKGWSRSIGHGAVRETNRHRQPQTTHS